MRGSVLMQKRGQRAVFYRQNFPEIDLKIFLRVLAINLDMGLLDRMKRAVRIHRDARGCLGHVQAHAKPREQGHANVVAVFRRKHAAGAPIHEVQADGVEHKHPLREARVAHARLGRGRVVRRARDGGAVPEDAKRVLGVGAPYLAGLAWRVLRPLGIAKKHGQGKHRKQPARRRGAAQTPRVASIARKHGQGKHRKQPARRCGAAQTPRVASIAKNIDKASIAKQPARRCGAAQTPRGAPTPSPTLRPWSAAHALCRAGCASTRLATAARYQSAGNPRHNSNAARAKCSPVKTCLSLIRLFHIINLCKTQCPRLACSASARNVVAAGST